MARIDDRSGVTDGESRAPLVDALEIAALVAIPAVTLAALAAVAGENPLIGLIFGAILGTVPGRIRRAMYAVRTTAGIERRPRRHDAGEEPGRLVRLADHGDGPRYELAIAVVLALVGVGALVALALFADDGGVARWLLALALFGIVGSLGAVGAYSLR